jgi:hypothetical protein
MGVVVVAVIAAVAGAVWFWGWLKAGDPLTAADADRLVRRRYDSRFRSKYHFNPCSFGSDLAFKASMVADGAFHDVNLPLEDALSVIASHLKHKKHEWVVFAFCRGDRVVRLWCNKGPDRTMVSPTLPVAVLTEMAIAHGCGSVVRAHNHPNSHGSRFTLLGPSQQDLVSAEYFGDCFSRLGVDFLDVVCERGDWLVFNWKAAHHSQVEDGLRHEATALNASDPSARRAARSEIRSGDATWSSRHSSAWIEHRARSRQK